MDKTRDCFVNAKKAEEKGKKHKGLLIIKPDEKKAKEYLSKAKMNLEFFSLHIRKMLAIHIYLNQKVENS